MRFRLSLSGFFASLGLSVCLMFLSVSFALAAAPAVVTNVVPLAASGQVSLTWTNPASVDFTGTMVRYSTTAFPTSTTDGTLASDVAGDVSGTSSLTVSSLTNNTTYYFSLFSHNVTPEYSTAVNAQQYVMAAQFTEDFESDSVAAVNGQNGWATVSGTWNVIDTAGEQTLQSGSDSLGFHLYRVLNGGSAAAYSDQMVRVDWKGSTTSTPGQVFLRAQSASADAGGYFMWFTGGQVRIAYKTSTGATQATLGSASFAISANTWYTTEFSAVNNSSGQTVLSGYVWARGNAKPSTPNVTYTDTFNRFAQGVFSVGKTGTTVAEFDNVTYYGSPGISAATATPADSAISLAWTNPTYATYTGTMVRYSTSAYPTSTSDGTLLSSVTGSSGATSTVTQSSLTNGTLYYYTLFPYDNVGAYGTPLYLRQVPYDSFFTDTFASSTVATISGQNGWSILGGTWAAADISSNRAVSGTAATPDFYTNKITNTSIQLSNQVLTARYQASAATNNAGQFWLRQQSDADAGYVFWHSGDTWTLSSTTTDATITTLATSTAAPPQEASVWYNVEVSVIDNGSNQPVLNLFIWKAGTEKPAVPQISYTDTTALYTQGSFALGKSNSAETGSFDDVYVYGSTPVATITSPSAAVVGATDVATLAIVDGGGTIYIPYIQTSTTLSITATAGALPSGGGVEFVLNEGLGSQQTSTDLSSPYTASFTSLAKGEYTVDIYTLQADGTTRYAGDDSHDERTDIGIGDIITVIGDSVTEGVSGTIDGGTVTSWLDGDSGTVSADNRQFPQHGSFGDTYKESFLTDLNDKLASYYGYPVFLMNEGVAGIKASNYVSSAINAAWTSRQNALAPNKWIVTLGVNDANVGTSAATYQTDMTALLSTLTTTYGATASQIYLNYPNYDGRTGSGGANSIYVLQYLTVIDTLRASLGLQGGADWYNPTSIHYVGEYTGTVHPNATGYVRIARIQGLSLMAPTLSSISSVTARQATVNWTSITASEATIAGYYVKYGTSSSSLTSTATFGDVATGIVTGLTPDTTYYFAVQAYDNDSSAISVSDLSTTSSTATQTIANLSSAITGDADSDGKIDRIVVTFSKDLDGSTVAGADFTVASYTVASASETSAGIVTIILTESASADSGATPLTSIAGSVSDTSANATTSGSATPTDAAAPMILSFSPTASAVGVLRQANIVVTFSEAINTASAAYTLAPTVASLTAGWSVGNTVLTLTHVVPFLGAGTYTFTVTSAPDLAAVALGGAISGVAHPTTFRTTPGSSTPAASSSSVTQTLSLSVSSPNGGEKYGAGDTKNIVWTSSDQVRIPVVDLSYSTDSGVSYTKIIQNIPNNGMYAWTVPSIASSHVRIRVRGSDLVTLLAQDESDADFSIVVPAVPSPAEAQDRPLLGGGEVIPLSPGAALVSGGSIGVSPFTGETEEVSSVAVGQYIRAEDSPTVYFVDEYGARRPFIDVQTFRTYGQDFSRVTTVTGATLPELMIGEPMLPKIGVVFVKIQSDPRVYLLESSSEGTALRWITSESVAQEMLGPSWGEYVIDLPPTLITRFVHGEDITESVGIDRSLFQTREVLQGE